MSATTLAPLEADTFANILQRATLPLEMGGAAIDLADALATAAREARSTGATLRLTIDTEKPT